MFSLQPIVLLIVSYFVIPRLTFLPKPLHSLLIVFGPFLLPRLANAFNNARAAARSAPVRPAPPKVKHALNLLLVSSVVCLVLSLSQFGPENVFIRTQSRLQIEPNTLLARLNLLNRPLTDEDEVLRSKFASMRNKLIYVAFGPDTLLNCVWCSTANGNDTNQFFLYTVPKIIKPHVLHLAVLGLATSSMVGAEGSRFRIHATIAGLSLLVAELFYLGTYDISANKRAKTLQEVDFVHWRIRVLRAISFAAVDAVLGLLLWLTSTNRWLAKPTSAAVRLETATRQVEQTMSRLHALSLLSNSINRDQGLRNLREAYWRVEGQQLAEVVQEEEVMAHINTALGKMDMSNVQGQIGEAADTVLASVDGLNGQSPPPAMAGDSNE